MTVALSLYTYFYGCLIPRFSLGTEWRSLDCCRIKQISNDCTPQKSAPHRVSLQMVTRMGCCIVGNKSSDPAVRAFCHSSGAAVQQCSSVSLRAVSRWRAVLRWRWIGRFCGDLPCWVFGDVLCYAGGGWADSAVTYRAESSTRRALPTGCYWTVDSEL